VNADSVSFILILFFLFIGFLLIKKSIAESKIQYRCTHCGYTGKAKRRYQGSGLIELVLWLFFIIPGLIYTLWRTSRKRLAICPTCNNRDMIPADLPLAMKVDQDKKCPYCAETVKKEAIICKHCGKELSAEKEPSEIA